MGYMNESVIKVMRIDVQCLSTGILRSHWFFICTRHSNSVAGPATGVATITLREKCQTIVVSSDRQTLGDSETRTRCFRRLHLLQASVTRCFLGAVVADGPAASLLFVEAACAASWPIRSVDCGEVGAAFSSSDDGFWLPDWEFL
jgi:hypothetical protein